MYKTVKIVFIILRSYLRGIFRRTFFTNYELNSVFVSS